MGLFNKLFGNRNGSPEDVTFTRGPTSFEASKGEEDAAFLSEVSAIFGCPESEVDFSKELQADLGRDEFEVIELIQIAEELWNVSLMPSTFDVSDAESILEKYKTLQNIVEACKTQLSN